jgi:hypothetical protein
MIKTAECIKSRYSLKSYLLQVFLKKSNPPCHITLKQNWITIVLWLDRMEFF